VPIAQYECKNEARIKINNPKINNHISSYPHILMADNGLRIKEVAEGNLGEGA
jgi:hypothetical protein